MFSLIIESLDPRSGFIKTNGKVELIPQLKRTSINKSGGEVTKEYILKSLAKNPNILLADEPTTNLDTNHIEWVANELKKFPGTLLLISHDRTLLDDLCDTIWELDEGKITVYPGNYSDYIAQREVEEQEQKKEYEKFKQKERQLKEAIELKDEKAARATKKPKNLSSSEARIKGAKPYFAKKQKKLHQNSKALQTRLNQLEVIEKPQEAEPIKMDLPNTRAFKNKTMVRAEQFKGKIKNKLLWRPTTFFLRGGDKVGIIGPNGSGKTTFLNKLLNKETKDLYVSSATKIAYFDQNINILEEQKSILNNVQENSKQNETLIRTVLARLGFYQEDVYKKVKYLSGGERVKVSLAKIFVSDCNTLILDEPTNFLDLYALEALEELLIDYEGTILFVSHDRHFISQIATKILYFENQKLILFEGDYDQYLTRKEESQRDLSAEYISKIEVEITAVLGQLSDPNLTEYEREELDKRFQQLLQEKKKFSN